MQCTLAKFKNKCLLVLTFGAPPQTLQRGFWKGILSDIKLTGNLKMQNSKTVLTKNAIFTLRSMALISFPQESHWSPLASWQRKKDYYSFKIFLRFWLAKIPRIIQHIHCGPNLEEFCDMWKMMSIVQHNCQKTEQLTEKTWEWGWVVLVVSTKLWNISLVSRGRSRRTVG